MTSAHDLYLAHDDTLGAARTAGWLALELLELGDLPLSGTWTARGLRLVERMEDSEAVGARSFPSARSPHRALRRQL